MFCANTPKCKMSEDKHLKLTSEINLPVIKAGTAQIISGNVWISGTFPLYSLPVRVCEEEQVSNISKTFINGKTRMGFELKASIISLTKHQILVIKSRACVLVIW